MASLKIPAPLFITFPCCVKVWFDIVSLFLCLENLASCELLEFDFFLYISRGFFFLSPFFFFLFFLCSSLFSVLKEPRICTAYPLACHVWFRWSLSMKNIHENLHCVWSRCKPCSTAEGPAGTIVEIQEVAMSHVWSKSHWTKQNKIKRNSKSLCLS